MILKWLLPAVAVPLIAAVEYQPVKEYDPGRDAVKDIRNAVAEAARTHRRVLLDVGGNWCSWCRTLDKFFADHADLTALINKNFVLVRVHYGPDNDNEEALGKYPHAEGYPHIYVLDDKGGLVRSQSTDIFEKEHGYDAEKWKAFLEKWAPPVQ
jgi:thioredoxin-related protein